MDRSGSHWVITVWVTVIFKALKLSEDYSYVALNTTRPARPGEEVRMEVGPLIFSV